MEKITREHLMTALDAMLAERRRIETLLDGRRVPVTRNGKPNPTRGVLLSEARKLDAARAAIADTLGLAPEDWQTASERLGETLDK